MLSTLILKMKLSMYIGQCLSSRKHTWRIGRRFELSVSAVQMECKHYEHFQRNWIQSQRVELGFKFKLYLRCWREHNGDNFDSWIPKIRLVPWRLMWDAILWNGTRPVERLIERIFLRMFLWHFHTYFVL